MSSLTLKSKRADYYLRILIVKTAIHQRFILVLVRLKLILMALGKIQHLYNIVI
jgi:hypothetical protein